MFIQVIQGQVSDAGQVKERMDRWVEELSSDATGWLGSTAGVTDEGRFIALARFESADAARRNSERAEQDRWWTETSELFTGEVTFRDSEDLVVDLVGDPDTAGFVQIIQGRGSDPARTKQLITQDAGSRWADFRPDILGSIAVLQPDGEYTTALYFTSEAEAREGERKQPPPELAAVMEEMNSLTMGEPTFFDLRSPWLASKA
jgi:hypothetical protein